MAAPPIEEDHAMNEDQVDGTVKDVTGKVKDAVGGLTGDAKIQGEGKADQVMGKAQETLGDVKDKAGDMADSASETLSAAAAKAAETLRETAETVRARAGEYGTKVQEVGASAGAYVGKTVQEQPLLSLIGIAAIGYLVGYLAHSPSSPFATPPEPRYRQVMRRWS
jgi:uncharacterized protein YjbJ (UPF0337 family)